MKLFTIPNLMTLGNLLCGCLGIIFVFEGNLLLASYLIFIAGILDFLDGFVARLLKSSSPIGKELDSLADMVTFGVLPAFIVSALLVGDSTLYSESIISGTNIPIARKCNLELHFEMFIPLILALFSALRLAKFNVDTRQSDSFIGVPTPANAMVVASFPLILNFNPEYSKIILKPYFLIGYSLIMSYLLVVELPLFALKFKDVSWANNKIKFIFLILSVILLIVFKFVAIPLIIFLYIVLSVVNRFWMK